MNLDLKASIDCHCRGGITQLFTHLNSLPELPLSAVVAPPPPLPPDQDLYPAFPAVLVEASHPKCLDTAVSKPPPPPATIKGVLLPLTTNVPPPPPELDALRVTLPSWPTSILIVSPLDKRKVPFNLAPLPRYWALLCLPYPPAAPIASIL